MAKLRTRKWGCALGIALLIAVVIMAVGITSTVLLGQSSTRPLTAEEMLRSLPLYPGAGLTSSTSREGSLWHNMNGATTRAEYQVNDTTEAVIDFYSDRLVRDGWQGGRGSSINELSYFRPSSTYRNLTLSDRPPWIKNEKIEVLYMLRVGANQVYGNEGVAEFDIESSTSLMYVYP